MCVHKGMISAAAGFEPGIYAHRFKDNHATNELYPEAESS